MGDSSWSFLLNNSADSGLFRRMLIISRLLRLQVMVDDGESKDPAGMQLVVEVVVKVVVEM